MTNNTINDWFTTNVIFFFLTKYLTASPVEKYQEQQREGDSIELQVFPVVSDLIIGRLSTPADRPFRAFHYGSLKRRLESSRFQAFEPYQWVRSLLELLVNYFLPWWRERESREVLRMVSYVLTVWLIKATERNILRLWIIATVSTAILLYI